MANPAPLELPPPRTIAEERWARHLVLLLVTFATVTGVQLLENHGTFGPALAFSCSLLAILVSHEMGHYLAGRLYGVSISLPYFIPVPLGIGTLGAVIRIRTPIPTRTALVDIGAAGPLAGMLVATPLLIWGIAHSRYAPAGYEAGLHLPGQFSVWAFLHAAREGWHVGGIRGLLDGLEAQVMPAKAAGWSCDSLLSTGLARLLLGPRPAGTDLTYHPVADAAWWGMLVTMLNLLPIGQLDGGHLAYALLGKRAPLVGRAIHLAMLGMIFTCSIFWIGWMLITRFVVGFGHPPVTDPTEPLSASRYIVCGVALAVLVLTFLPVPLELRPVP